MRNLLIAACCAALVGSVPMATAQTSGPTAQDSMKTSTPMNANAKMKMLVWRGVLRIHLFSSLL